MREFKILSTRQDGNYIDFEVIAIKNKKEYSIKCEYDITSDWYINIYECSLLNTTRQSPTSIKSYFESTLKKYLSSNFDDILFNYLYPKPKNGNVLDTMIGTGWNGEYIYMSLISVENTQYQTNVVKGRVVRVENVKTGEEVDINRFY
tara:strand:+ start:94 stop:537 length:444 start_codon:yes stop_codon:yes gene_type:complete